ncbi:hypothetical protein GOP47_0028294 [Adiantum capillus-veneris]|nr:hypothetical protein GOP47_0028294 [Adiantum capillus-veneris]
MDALVAVALQEVAAEGEQGASLPNLWKWLESSSSRSGLLLDPALKQALWKLLLSSSCLTFKDQSSIPLASITPSIQAYQDAEGLDIRIVASEDLRDSFLGVYAIRHSDSKLSTEQRRMLERIGRARANGITQYEIGKEFGISGNKLFYVIKNLESRGLLVRQSSIFRGERPIATNLIHLKRFAKTVKLGSQQRFEIQKAGLDHGKSDAKATEGSKHEGDVKGVLVNDDLPALKSICKKLEEAPKKVLVIADLKVNLGYRLTRGHREWRRILGRLVGAGMVEVFEAKVENKVLPCLRLLKPFDLKAFNSKDNRANSEQTESDRSARGAKRGQITEQVAELSINRQIYEIIKQGGTEGVPVTEIFSSLGLNNRKNYYRLSDMIPKHGLHLRVENHKRSTQYRVCIPADPFCVPSDFKDRTESRDSSRDSKVKEVSQLSAEANTSMETSAGEQIFKQPTEGAWLSENIVSEDGNIIVEERSDVIGLDMVPYNDIENLEASEQIPMPVSNIRSSAPLISMNDASPIALSVSSQRTVALSSAHTQREIWIMERLERESFVLRSELHKWLEELECRTNSILDRKTVIRNLQRLEKQGRCKCILVSLPGVTNYGQMRTVDVVLLPSVEVGPELLSEIYERQRAFDMQIRTQGVCRRRKIKADIQVPTMSGLMRMPKTEVVDKGGTLQDNGFICAKLVRCRMLHRFFWLYVTGDADNNSHVKAVLEHPTTSSSGIFSLLAAVQSMPLELFLQVIGSAKHIKGLTECCRRGMKLSDLPTRESEALLDINASGRVAWLVDILRRLKLLRIVMIPAASDSTSAKQSRIGVAYALELKPFIDEPGVDPPSSISAHFLNSGPAPRHFFDLSSLENLEEYWGTLEYFFRGSNSAAARRIFPGSTVPELFGARSWSSLRVMSMDQRIELQKRINADDNKRLHYEECVRIARELSLSLDQVLNASYEKNQKMKFPKSCSTELDPFNSEKINIALGKMCMAASDGIVGATSLEITKVQHQFDEHLSTEAFAQHSSLDESPEAGSKRKRDSLGLTVDAYEDVEPTFASEINVVKKFRPFRKRKFPWKDGLDRVVLACYTRQRALLGARYNRVEWNTIPGLPAPPVTCRRRVAFLKMNPIVRKAIVALCNLLGTRYTKFLCSKAKAAQGASEHEDPLLCCNDYGWDDFKDPILSAAVNDIILCKKAGRASSSKKTAESLSLDKRSLKVIGPIISDLSDNSRTAQSQNSGSPCLQTDDYSNELVPSMRTAVSARARPNRKHLRKTLQKPLRLNHVTSTQLVRNSLGAAVAVELIKLVFLNSAAESQVSEILVHALRRCKENDIFTAFRFLKDQGMVASGESGFAFVLSPKFFQNAAFSPFGPTTAEESMKFENWLKSMKPYLEQDWVTLRPELEWGELFCLFAAVSVGSLSIAPFVPEKGIGEKDQDEVIRKRKRDAFNVEDEPGAVKMRVGGTFEKSGFGDRRERGFPGIDVKICTATMPFESLLAMDSCVQPCVEFPFQSEASPSTCKDASRASTCLESVPPAPEDILSCESFDIDSGDVAGSKGYPETISLEDRAGYVKTSDLELALKKACVTLSSAGEEGLRFEELVRCLEVDDNPEAASELYAKLLYSGHAKEVMAFDHTRLISPPHNERFFLHLSRPGEFDAVEMVPILPWLEASGKENDNLRKSLYRRVMGIVILNPGISEGSITEQIDVLNPTSCQKLLELMILDGHLYVQTRAVYNMPSMPRLLQGASLQKRKCITRKYYYANSASSSLL